MDIYLRVLQLVLFIVIIGCASSGGTSQTIDESASQNKISSVRNLTLEDYLRKLNGVIVRGNGNNVSVTIRSNMSVTDPNQQPLFVLNGESVGRSYAEVVQLISRSIKSVEALPPSQSSIYGLQGGAGVIIIETE